MPPQVQASFIPKKSFGGGAVAPHHTIGVVWFISVAVFIASIAAAGGVFFYQQYLTGVIQTESDSLTRAKAAYDPSVINSIIKLDDRLKQANSLLQNHVAPSAIFTFLGTATVPKVRFTALSYAMNINGTASLQVTGEALDFASVALQSDAFSASHELNDILFSDINVDPASGHIVFKVSATAASTLLLYRDLIGQGNGSSGASTPTTVSSATQ